MYPANDLLYKYTIVVVVVVMTSRVEPVRHFLYGGDKIHTTNKHQQLRHKTTTTQNNYDAYNYNYNTEQP